MATTPTTEEQRQLINEDDWFVHIAGATETEVAKDRSKYILAVGDKQHPPGSEADVHELVVRNPVSSTTHAAGTFYLAPIKLLRAEIHPTTVQPTQQCVLELLTRGDYYSTKYVDVAQLQADPANAGAMFQAASNFNGVEAVSESSTPDTPQFTEHYTYDRTQGPAASIGAPAAAITRVHAAFFDPAQPPELWAQTATHQLQMLEHVSQYYTVINGYVVNGKKHPREESLPESDEACDVLLGEVRVGVHLGVAAEFGERGADGMVVVQHPHKINQVFCAAMNVGQGASGMRNFELPDARKKARFLLRAAYQGSYLAAIANGCKKLFLTMIGGGVFGNNFDDIFEEIYQAHTQLALGPHNACLTSVYLVLFSAPPGREEFIARLMQNKIPFRSTVFVDNKPQIDHEYIAPKL